MYSSKKLSMSLLPKVPGLQLKNIAIDAKTVSLSVASIRLSASCPLCGHKTARLHSHYRRTVADLPWGGRSVRLSLLVRRFRCSAPECPRRIFAERLASVVEPYARKTTRLHEILRLVGFALGGEGRARLLWCLGMRASPSTLMRYVRGSPRVVHPPSEAVGIDDWAFRRGHQYGTIIVDLHRHEVIELLEDREATSVFAWLKRHPEIRLIARDRGGVYAEAAAKGAPQAVQVADRWHLLSRTPRRQSNALSSAITPSSGKQPRGSYKRSESTPLSASLLTRSLCSPPEKSADPSSAAKSAMPVTVK